jgi:Bacteriocin-protection, YdeI or OmpD-Associated/Domain of unknown function (DUF1905)
LEISAGGINRKEKGTVLAAVTQKFKCTLEPDEKGIVGFIRMPFDVKAVFGKGKVPVKLTINGYTYRTTICHMKDIWGAPLRKEHREIAKVKAGDVVQVSVEEDIELRIVEVPADMKKFLRSEGVWEVFEKLSYTHKKEHVEWITTAKKEETREARKQKMVEMLSKRRG